MLYKKFQNLSKTQFIDKKKKTCYRNENRGKCQINNLAYINVALQA